MTTTLRVKIGKRWYTVEISDLFTDPVMTLVDGEEVQVNIQRTIQVSKSQQSISPVTTPAAAPSDPPVAVPASARPIKQFKSPMPGGILSVVVQVGDQVVTGDEICVLEAMKMQQTLRADWSGIVSKVHVQSGHQVLDGDPIIDL